MGSNLPAGARDGKLQLHAISPRHIEACATRTCQVLVEGDLMGHDTHGLQLLARAHEKNPDGKRLLLTGYAASIGGLGTLIGTPPNAFMAGYMSETYDVQIGFAQWMALGLPLSAALLACAWHDQIKIGFSIRRARNTAVAMASSAM